MTGLTLTAAAAYGSIHVSMSRLSSKIFIDGGVPDETRQANERFFAHFSYPLDGQTTNPTLIAKNLKARMDANPTAPRLTEALALEEYKKIVQEISSLLPHGSVSIQVFADQNTPAPTMLTQAADRITWIPNASIKLPCTTEGLRAGQSLCQKMPLNFTLVFSQSQAAAVYEATKGAKFPVFLSPFVGRLDDRGENGMQVIENILKLYQEGDGHVETLTASVRSIEHIKYALYLKSPIITIPAKVFLQWADEGFSQPDTSYAYQQPANIKPLPYQPDVTLGKPWDSYDLHHDLTDKGLTAFWNDWTGLFS